MVYILIFLYKIPGEMMQIFIVNNPDDAEESELSIMHANDEEVPIFYFSLPYLPIIANNEVHVRNKRTPTYRK